MVDATEPAPENEEEAKMLQEWNLQAQEAATAKELNQNEIDNLLGFEINSNSDNSRGIKAMIDKNLDSYERFPMLEVVFEKFIRLLSTSLRNLTEENVDLYIESIQSLRFGNFINSVPMPACVNIFRAHQWDHFGLFVPDSSLIFCLLDILFGGKKNLRNQKVEGRPYTTIEQNLVKQMCEIVLSDLSESFETLSPVTLKFERQETDPRFATIARSGDSIALVQVAVDMENNRSGKFWVLFPHDALEPIKELLLHVFVGEQYGLNNEWLKGLVEKIKNTDMTIEAILKSRTSSIEAVSDLKVGTTVIFDATPDEDVAIVCNGEEILKGKLGKIGSKVAISLNHSVKEYNLEKET